MDKNKRIVAIIGLIIGMAFLAIGILGIKNNNTPSTLSIDSDEQASVTNSADPLDNIAQ